jgi:hypothetical protein
MKTSKVDNQKHLQGVQGKKEVEKMKKNYKLELSSAALRNWNDGMVEYWNNGMASFGQINACGGIKLSIVNCQLSIFNETSTPVLLGIPNYYSQNYKKKTKGIHGLHQDSFKLQTMTALIKSFYGGSRGACFTFSRKELPWQKSGG